MGNTSFNNDLMLMQGEINPLSVKWRLMLKWVNRIKLDKFIDSYVDAVNNIVYPE
jgi:hypothetical protein